MIRCTCAWETSLPTGINDELISFGPSFGPEAQREFLRRLEELGLVYFEDFFDINVDHPVWCAFLITSGLEDPAARHL